MQNKHKHKNISEKWTSRRSSKRSGKSSKSRKSSKSIPRKLQINEINIESIPVKSNEFTLRSNKEKIVSVIK